MIPSQFYLPTTYQITSTTPNEYGLSPSLSDINETGDFTTSYWTGWIKQENAPPSWTPYKFNIIDGNYVFETLTPDNINLNFGYFASGTYPNPQPLPTFISKYNDVWSGRYYLSSSDIYFPNDYDFKNVGMANSVYLRFIRVRINTAEAEQSYYCGYVTINYTNLNDDDYAFTIDNTSFTVSEFLKNGWCIKNDNYLYFIVDYGILTLSGYMSAVSPHYGVTTPRLQPMIAFSSGDDKIISCGLSSLGGQSGYLFDTYFNGSGVTNGLNVHDNIYLGGLNITISQSDLTGDFETNGYLVYNDKYIVCYPTNTYSYYTLTRAKAIAEVRKHFNLNRIVTVDDTHYYYGYGDKVVYWPEIINNEYTGNAITGTEQDLSDKLPEWIKDGDNTKNEYTEDDLPQPIQPDDGEDDTRKRNDGTNLPLFDGIRAVSGTGFSTFYLLSSYHVAELGQLLSSMPQDFWVALGTATDYKMSNMLDYISALKWYPLDIHATAPSNFPDMQISDMQFGFNGVSKVTFTAVGTSFKLGTVNRVYDMGSVSIPYRSGNGQTFLDLEPYTDVYINLPYIGKTQLQANQVIGYTISVHYVIDLITGMCTCFVDNGYDTLYVGSGKIGVDITVAGNDVITQAERMTSAYVGTVTHGISNALSLGGALSSEDVAGAASGYSNMISGIVSDCISTANAKRGVPQVVGGGSGFGSTYAAQSPCIIVHRPAVKIPAAYGHSIGYICNVHASIGSLQGYTLCDNPDLTGIAATDVELEMIKSILTTGFYA